MKNYICIDGKKAELTEEQLKALGIEITKASPFDRVENCKSYYAITSYGKVAQFHELHDNDDNRRFDIANYCADYSLMKQRALHETLDRLLWRYSMTHNGNEIDWTNRNTIKYRIVCRNGKFSVEASWLNINIGCVAFAFEEIAEHAIIEIIEPFMKEHPEFKW